MKLLGRHIFKAGTWNGKTFTKKDLDDIVNNFAKLREIHHVPLKFGHNKAQKITDGQPAIGWITSVYRKGKDLFADFDHIPKIVMKAIEEKRYRTTSIEIIKNTKIDGKEITSWLLDAVSLLGADQPAVSGLQDLADLSLARATLVDGEAIEFSKAGNFNPLDEEDTMTPKELSDAIALALAPVNEQLAKQGEEITKLTADNKKLTDDNAELTRKKKDREDADAKDKIDLSRKAATEILDGAVRQKTITPAQREIHEATFGVADDEAVQKIDLKSLAAVTGYKEEKKDAKSKTFDRDEEAEEMNDKPLDEQVVLATRQIQAKNPKLSYTESQELAFMADPELAQKYVDSNGTFDSDGGVVR